jgi:hypothetical protein
VIRLLAEGKIYMVPLMVTACSGPTPVIHEPLTKPDPQAKSIPQAGDWDITPQS